MNVIWYTGFSKDINSTKRPSTEAQFTSDCQIFEPCSILNPSFIIGPSGGDNIYKNVTYCYVPNWQRYYWITDRRYYDGRFIISASIDVLGTYKTEIGLTSQYVLRSASSSNGEITDLAYPMTGEVTSSMVYPYSGLDPFQSSLSDGIFIVGIVGEADTSGSTRYGAVNYYEFNASEFGTFLTALMSNQNDWLDVQDSDLSDSTTKMILNPMQYITCCMWFPLSRTGTPSSRTIKFGWWEINGITCATPGVSGGIPARGGSFGFNTSGARHPQQARGNYMNRAPYAEYNLYIPCVGNIPIDADIYAQTKYIDVTYYIDYPTGQGVIRLQGAANADGTGTVTHIGYTNFKVGVDVPIAQIAVDTISTAKGGINTIQGAAAGFATGGILGAVFGAINSAIDTTVHAVEPLANIMASVGSLACYQFHTRLYCKFKTVTADAPVLLGQPLCDLVQINTLSGFLQCGTNHIAIKNATREELTQIETYLKEGFYYE